MTSRISYLHPETVEDLVEEFLSSDFISTDELIKLKNDSKKLVDPNILFDLRHKKRKQQFLPGENGHNTKLERRTNEETNINMKLKIKDLKRIDKEISSTKRNLEVFQKQLDKKKEIFQQNILKMEANIKENKRSPNSLSSVEYESKHYFELHLDRLENDASIISKQKQKIWKPIEPQDPPIINVITTMKTLDDKASSIEFDEEEKFILKMITDIEYEMIKPPEYSLEKCSIVSNHLLQPEITSELYDYESKRDKLIKTQYIVKKVIKKWKLYVRKNIIQRIIFEKEYKFKTNLLRKYFSLWVEFTDNNKLKRKNRNNKFEKDNQGSEQHTTINKFANTKSKHKNNGNFNIHNQIFVSSIIIGPTFINCPVQQIATGFTPSFITPRDNKLNGEAIQPKIIKKQLHNEEKQLEVNIINIEDVDIEQSGTITKTDANYHVSTEERRESASKKLCNPNTGNLSCRYAAQQKIISKQLALIEEQKLLISNLRAQCLETKSKLSLKTVENELKNAVKMFDKRFEPVVKMIKTCETNFSREPEKVSNFKRVDNSERLTKSMFERQEYCKYLAEKTRIRKVRMEEEQAKLKLEDEERLKRLKEQEKLLIKKEQILSEENKKKALEYKLRITKLNEVAINYYKNKLQRKYFNKFKKVLLKMHHMADNCNIFYEKKLLQKCVSIWRSQVNEYVMLKNNLADQHYHTRLLGRSWHSLIWIYNKYQSKVQESENIYVVNLKRKMFKNWISFMSQKKLETSFKMELAERLHRKHLLKQTFGCWKELPTVMFHEYKKEKLRRAWRQAVREVVPDFNPRFADDFNLD